MNYNIFKKACAILKDEDTIFSDESRKKLVEIIEAAENLPDCRDCPRPFYYPSSPLIPHMWTSTSTDTNSVPSTVTVADTGSATISSDDGIAIANSSIAIAKAHDNKISN